MNTQHLLDAIEGIGDSYVMEFAEIRPKKKMFLGGLAAAAACICLLLTAVLTYPKENKPSVTPTMPDGNVIWGPTYGNIWAESPEQANSGEILFTPMLEEAFARSKNPSDTFAIRVNETTGAAPEQIYEEFIKPLGIYEEYLEKGIIFATQEQAKGISAPAAFGVVLDLALESNDNDCQEPVIETTVPVVKDEDIAETINGDAAHNSNAVIGIVDLTEEKGLITLTALELFYEDEEYAYYFSSIKSELVYVKYADQTEKPIKEALANGDVTVQDLDRFGILYYKESLSAKQEP